MSRTVVWSLSRMMTMILPISLLLLGAVHAQNAYGSQSPGPSFPGPSYPSPSFPSPSPSYPSPSPSYPAPAPSFPAPAPQPSYPQPAPQPSFPQPAPQPSYPRPAPQPSYPQPAPQPSFPQPAPQPSYPQPAPGPQTGYPPQPQTSFPSPGPTAPLYPYPGQQGGGSFPAPAPSYPQPGPAFPQPGTGYPQQGGDDPCFRKYSNCIIVNAQPYERRSTVDVAACKTLCLSSNTGIFQCRAFVYDNVNQVCDLFGHTGNQYPARLMAFNGRDYYEPLQTPECTGGAPAPSPGPGTPSPSNVDGPTCPANQEARLLRIEGFSLQGSDDVTLPGISVDECADACIDNQASDGTASPCQSFDYSNGDCIVTTEAAVPSGNGQLVQSADSDYYEKICVSAEAAASCPLIFERFPQMILVGFAETVVDANSFEECLDNCLNAQELYSFTCASGMFYFQEDQLNCILNSEDRTTQPELFVEEENDIVDYFETRCTQRSGARARRLRPRGNLDEFNARAAVISRGNSSSSRSAERDVLTRRFSSGSRSSSRRAMTQWSACDDDNEQTRYERCEEDDSRQCRQETRSCERSASPPQLTLPADCAPEECCAVFGGCRIGLREDENGVVQWCTDPCAKTV